MIRDSCLGWINSVVLEASADARRRWAPARPASLGAACLQRRQACFDLAHRLGERLVLALEPVNRALLLLHLVQQHRVDLVVENSLDLAVRLVRDQFRCDFGDLLGYQTKLNRSL